ncbi:rhodanese-like domain-containing protein 9, chloroplastic [Tanacetum coccineum]
MHNNFSGLFYGIPFTKPNTEFVQSVKSQFSPDSKILVVCQEGLRSAGAANKLEAAGFQNIACISSGLQSVKPGLFDVEGSIELKDAGKAGLVQVQGKISAVLGTILICREDHCIVSLELGTYNEISFALVFCLNDELSEVRFLKA